MDGVDGSDSVSGKDDKVVSDEVAIGSLTFLVLLVSRIVLSNRVKVRLGKVGSKDFHVFVLMLVMILDVLIEY